VPNSENLLEEVNPFLSKSLDAASAATSVDPTPVIRFPHLALWERSSLASVASLHKMKSHFKDPLPAYDRICRIQSFQTLTGEQILNEIFPKNINLLQLLLITNLVHEKDRFYSLFNHQCFWFSNLILQCVDKIFGNSSLAAADLGFDPKQRQDASLFLTRSALVQSTDGQLFVKGKEAGWEAGTWMKILVAPIEVLLVNKIIGEFELLWGEEENEV